MSIVTMYEYAEKIGRARVTVRAKIEEYDIKPVGAVKVGNNKRPSYLYDERDLKSIFFHEKAGRPCERKETSRKNLLRTDN